MGVPTSAYIIDPVEPDMMRERSEGDEVLGDEVLGDEVFPFGMHPPRPLSGGGKGRAAISDKQ